MIFVPHIKKHNTEKKEPGDYNTSCVVLCCWGAESRQQLSDFNIPQLYYEEHRTESFQSPWNWGQDEKLSPDSLLGKIRMWVGDGLVAASFRPPNLLCSRRITRCSYRTQISCGSNRCLYGCMQGHQGTISGSSLWVRIKGVNPVFHRITKCISSFHIHKETHLLIFFLFLWPLIQFISVSPFSFFPLCSPLCTDVKFSTYSPWLGFFVSVCPLVTLWDLWNRPYFTGLFISGSYHTAWNVVDIFVELKLILVLTLIGKISLPIWSKHSQFFFLCRCLVYGFLYQVLCNFS